MDAEIKGDVMGLRNPVIGLRPVHLSVSSRYMASDPQDTMTRLGMPVEPEVKAISASSSALR